MKAYNYDPDSKKYISSEDVFPDPLEKGNWLVPANSTLIAPPRFNQNEEARWNGSSWDIVKILPKTDPAFSAESVELSWDLVKQKYGATWDNFNSFRSLELSKTDWIALPDVVNEDKQAWLNYRQQLRDLPEHYDSPDKIVWPTKP